MMERVTVHGIGTSSHLRSASVEQVLPPSHHRPTVYQPRGGTMEGSGSYHVEGINGSPCDWSSVIGALFGGRGLS